MDDFNIQALTESRNSYTNLLLSKITPQICQGFEAIFKDTYNLCEENDEEEKYLMTFQNFLARIPNWSQTMINDEVERIISECNCSYLEDLLTCVHVTQLKILTSVRVGQKQKNISIDVPSIHTFVHNVYKYCARTLYKNVYLYDINVMPLEKQKYKKEIELIVKDEIVNVIRSSMPIESILKAYLDETTEQYDELEESELEKELVLQAKEKELKQTELQNPQSEIKPKVASTIDETKTIKEPVIASISESVSPKQETVGVKSMSESMSEVKPVDEIKPDLSKPVDTYVKVPLSVPVEENIHESQKESFIGSEIPQSNSSVSASVYDIETESDDDERLSIDFESNSNVDFDLQDISSEKSKNLLNMDDIEELH
jgi:hypothetical protein